MLTILSNIFLYTVYRYIYLWSNKYSNSLVSVITETKTVLIQQEEFIVSNACCAFILFVFLINFGVIMTIYIQYITYRYCIVYPDLSFMFSGTSSNFVDRNADIVSNDNDINSTCATLLWRKSNFLIKFPYLAMFIITSYIIVNLHNSVHVNILTCSINDCKSTHCCFFVHSIFGLLRGPGIQQTQRDRILTDFKLNTTLDYPCIDSVFVTLMNMSASSSAPCEMTVTLLVTMFRVVSISVMSSA